MATNTNTRQAARGITCVLSTRGPECHPDSAFAVNDRTARCECKGCKEWRAADKSRKGNNPECDDYSSRMAWYRDMLAFWEAQGVARWVQGRNARGHFTGLNGWEVRDVINPEASGEWFPLAGQCEDTRSDRAVFSHMIPSSKGGCACGGNVVPEVGAFNHSRGDARTPLTDDARALLAAWPAWYLAHLARPASRKRLGV